MEKIRPINGQKALDNSVLVKEMNDGSICTRIGISHGQLVLLQGENRKFHGEVMEWHELDNLVQNILREHRFVEYPAT